MSSTSTTEPQKPASGGSQGSVAKSASIMAAGTLSSRIFGLLRDVILLNLFNRTLTDAWLVAFRLPNFFRRLLGEGSLSNSFIPVYVDLKENHPERARQLVSGIYALILVSLVVFVSMGIIFADPIIRWWVGGSGYASVPGKIELTVFMARIMFGFLLGITHFAFFMALCHAHGRFALPAVAPCFFNIGVITFALLAGDEPAVMLATGVVVGGALQALAVIPDLRRLSISLQPRFVLNEDVKRVLVNMLPGMIGMGTVQIMSLINTALTSKLKEGSHTWIYSADRVLEFPLSLIAVSIGSALLPTLSRHWAKNDLPSFRRQLGDSISMDLFLAIPSAIGMIFLAEHLVSLLLAWRSTFGAEDIANTAMILRAYGVLLISASLVKVIAPAFFARKNTWFPAAVAVGALTIHLFLAPQLMDRFGLIGLVYSVIISSLVNLSVLITVFHFKTRLMPFVEVAKNLLPMIPGFALTAGLCWLMSDQIPSSGPLWNKLLVLACIFGVMICYFAAGSLFRVPLAVRLAAGIKARILRR